VAAASRILKFTSDRERSAIFFDDCLTELDFGKPSTRSAYCTALNTVLRLLDDQRLVHYFGLLYAGFGEDEAFLCEALGGIAKIVRIAQDPMVFCDDASSLLGRIVELPPSSQMELSFAVADFVVQLCRFDGDLRNGILEFLLTSIHNLSVVSRTDAIGAIADILLSAKPPPLCSAVMELIPGLIEAALDDDARANLVFLLIAILMSDASTAVSIAGYVQLLEQWTSSESVHLKANLIELFLLLGTVMPEFFPHLIGPSIQNMLALPFQTTRRLCVACLRFLQSGQSINPEIVLVAIAEFTRILAMSPLELIKRKIGPDILAQIQTVIRAHAESHMGEA
jgi:hypothetical protein